MAEPVSPRPAESAGRSGPAPSHRPDAPPPPPLPAEPVVDEVEEASIDSFPASDAPAWTELAAGPPAREPEEEAGGEEEPA